MLAEIARWDTRVSLALQARRARLPNFVFAALSWSGAGGVWFALAGVLMLAQRRGLALLPGQLHFILGLLAAFAALLIGSVLKTLAGRRRPFASEQGITAAIWAPGRARSFPSTHAATAVALAVALLVMGHSLGPVVTVWALGVSFSRVWLGVHYPSDVLGGAALGAGVGLLPWLSLL